MKTSNWFQNMNTGHITDNPSGPVESLSIAEISGVKVKPHRTKKAKGFADKWRKLNDELYGDVNLNLTNKE
jgi:hypothetical protein